MSYNIVGYARVSSREQAENCHALEQQIDRLKSAGADYVLHDVESGANPDRPDFNQLMQLVADKQINTVIATRWDRLTRNETIYIQLKEIFQRSLVKIKLLDQGDVDFETASGMLNSDLQVIFAVHERRMLKERVSRGFEYKRKRKSAWGRQPWGYKSEDERYVIDKTPLICLLEQRPDNYQEFSDLANKSSLLIDGISKGEIAREAIEYFLKVRKPNDVLRYLNEKYGISLKFKTNLIFTPELLFWRSGQSFMDWIKNPVLRGHTAYNKYEQKNERKRGNQKPPEEWEVHENTHPGQVILSEEEYSEVLAIIKHNHRTMGNLETRSQLTGLVICGECGTKCVSKVNNKYRYYGCRNAGVGCHNKKNIRVDIMEKTLFEVISEKARNFINIDVDKNIQKNNEDSPEVIKLKEQIANLDKMLVENYSDILKKAKDDLEQEIIKKNNYLETDNFQKATIEEILSYPYLTHLGFWYCLNIKERELIYSKLIRRIVVINGEIDKIEFNL